MLATPPPPGPGSSVCAAGPVGSVEPFGQPVQGHCRTFQISPDGVYFRPDFCTPGTQRRGTVTGCGTFSRQQPCRRHAQNSAQSCQAVGARRAVCCLPFLHRLHGNTGIRASSSRLRPAASRASAIRRERAAVRSSVITILPGSGVQAALRIRRTPEYLSGARPRISA